MKKKKRVKLKFKQFNDEYLDRNGDVYCKTKKQSFVGNRMICETKYKDGKLLYKYRRMMGFISQMGTFSEEFIHDNGDISKVYYKKLNITKRIFIYANGTKVITKYTKKGRRIWEI